LARLYISLLGTYCVNLDGVPLSGFDSDKTRLLLAYLAVEVGKAQRREHLASLFWPEQPEASARRSLSQALYNLRKLLEEHNGAGEQFLISDALTVQFNPGCSYSLDIRLFTELLSLSESHVHRYLEACPDCLKRLQEAQVLYQGDFLSGLVLDNSITFEEWVLVQREHLHRRALGMYSVLAQSYENRGELRSALNIARQQVQLDPLWEAGQRQLMRMLALDGQYSQASAQYESYKQLLARELAVLPEKETQDLAEQLGRENLAEISMSRLPAATSPFIGRKEELAELHCYLHDPACRLLTIIGPGGSGKTRLALEEAYRQRYQFRDGVYFIPLSALGPASSLMAVIAEETGFTFGEIGDKKLQLMDYLRNKQMLFVFDSFETVAVQAGLVAEILSVSKATKVLVTSRVQLNLSGEQLYPLKGMQVPPIEAEEDVLSYSAAELFLQTARRVKPGYQPDNLQHMGGICRLVEGMPLSLQLAATWVGEYSTLEIAEQISHSMDFLSVEWADLPERQRNLRATFEYSWKLLNTVEQEIMMKLAVFRNAFTAQAADQVAGASPKVLHSLAGKSLLGNVAEGKFQMHDLVRQFSCEKLSQASSGIAFTTYEKHADYFARRMEAWVDMLDGLQESIALGLIDTEIDDAQAAWDWMAGEGKDDWLWKASTGLFSYYSMRDRHKEAEHACQAAIEALKSAPAEGKWTYFESRLLVLQAVHCQEQGKIERARQLINSAQDRLNQAKAMGQDIRSGQARIWASCDLLTDNLQEKVDYLQRSAALWQEVGNLWGQSSALMYAGEIVWSMGNPSLARELENKSLELSREIGDPHLIAHALMHLAYNHLFYGPWETGLQQMQESAEWYKVAGNFMSKALGEVHLAVAIGWSGRFEEACSAMEKALVTTRQWGYRFLIMAGTMWLGMFQTLSGRYHQASITNQEALRLARQDDFTVYEAHCLGYTGYLALLKGEPDEALVVWQRCAAIYQRIEAMGMMEIAFIGVVLAQHMLGQTELAMAGLKKGLDYVSETHDRNSLFVLAPALVIQLADSDKWEKVIEAHTALMTDPLVENSRAFVDLIGNRMAIAREQLSEEDRQAAEKRGREGDLFEVLGRLA
jgi:DNA-binding SARP family transcriptional activator/predicted ATPase